MVNGGEPFSTDIIVPVLNNLDLTKKFIESAKRQMSCNLIVIDNGSDEPTSRYLDSIASTIILIKNKRNLGYVRAINQGLAKSTANTILLANNDTYLPANLIENLRKCLHEYDIVSPLSNNVGSSDDLRLIQYPFESDEYAEDFSKELLALKRTITSSDYVFGHCMLMKREVFKSIGYLDERFGIGNYDDVDYCKRATNYGFKIGIVNNLFIYHECHATFKDLGIDVEKIIDDNKKVFEKKWDARS